MIHLVAAGSGTAHGAGMAGYSFLVAIGGGLAPIVADALAPFGFGATLGVLAAVLPVPACTLAVHGRRQAEQPSRAFRAAAESFTDSHHGG